MLSYENLFSQKVWSLEECISYALHNNLQINKKKIELENSRQDTKLAKDAKLPNLGFVFNNQANFGQSQDIFGSVRRNDNYNNNIGVNAQVLLFNNFRLKKELEKAESDFMMSHHALENIRQNTKIRVTRAYLNVLLAKETVMVADSSTQNAKRVLERSTITTNAGTTALSVKYEAEANYAMEKRKFQLAKIDVRRALLELSQLLQLDNLQIIDVELIDENKLLISNIQFLDSEQSKFIIDEQPILKMYQSSVHSAKLQSAIIKSQYGPSIVAGINMGTSYFNAFQDNTAKQYWQQSKENFAQQMSLSISMPIFDKNKKHTLLYKSKMAEELAKNELDIYKQIVRQDLEKLFFDIESSYENYLASSEAVKSAGIAALFAQKSYEAGKSSIYDVTNSRNNLIAAKSAMLQAKYNWVFNQKLLEIYSKESK